MQSTIWSKKHALFSEFFEDLEGVRLDHCMREGQENIFFIHRKNACLRIPVINQITKRADFETRPGNNDKIRSLQSLDGILDGISGDAFPVKHNIRPNSTTAILMAIRF